MNSVGESEKREEREEREKRERERESAVQDGSDRQYILQYYHSTVLYANRQESVDRAWTGDSRPERGEGAIIEIISRTIAIAMMHTTDRMMRRIQIRTNRQKAAGTGGGRTWTKSWPWMVTFSSGGVSPLRAFAAAQSRRRRAQDGRSWRSSMQCACTTHSADRWVVSSQPQRRDRAALLSRCQMLHTCHCRPCRRP
jgi:hypothetical protein